MCVFKCPHGGQLQELASSSHHVGPRNQTKVVMLVGKHLYLLSHLMVPKQSRACVQRLLPNSYKVNSLQRRHGPRWTPWGKQETEKTLGLALLFPPTIVHI